MAIITSQTATAEELDATFFDKSGLSAQSPTDDELKLLKSEFSNACALLMAKAPDYAKPVIQARILAEAPKYRRKVDQHVTDDIKSRETKRILYNITINLIRLASSRFPAEDEWRRTKAIYSAWGERFESEIAKHSAIPPSVVEDLKLQFRSLLGQLSEDALSATCYAPIDKAVSDEVDLKVVKFMGAVNLYFSRQGKSEVKKSDKTFVDEAYSDFFSSIIESVNSRLASEVPAGVHNAQVRLDLVRKNFSQGFDEAMDREFAAKHAVNQARFKAASTPEAIAAEVAKNRAEILKQQGPVPTEAPKRAH